MNSSSSGSDIFLAALQSDNGDYVWARAIGTGDFMDPHIGCIATDPAGDIMIAGTFADTLVVDGVQVNSAGSQDMFVLKFRGSDGHLMWQKTYGGQSGQGTIDHCDFDDASNTYLAGSFFGSLDVGLASPIMASSSTDALLLKLAGNDGHTLGAKVWGSSGQDQAIGLNVYFGTVIVTGFISPSHGEVPAIDGHPLSGGGSDAPGGNADTFVAMFDSSLNATWAARFGNFAFDQGTSAAFDGDGRPLISGEFSGVMRMGGFDLGADGGPPNCFVARLGIDDGTVEWAVALSPGARVFDVGVAAGENDYVFVGGNFKGNATFFTRSLSALNDYNGFLLQVLK
jgi:hypothetical protein